MHLSHAPSLFLCRFVVPATSISSSLSLSTLTPYLSFHSNPLANLQYFISISNLIVITDLHSRNPNRIQRDAPELSISVAEINNSIAFTRPIFATNMAELDPSKKVADRYLKREVLGEGTYGVVYKAIDTQVNLLRF